MSIVSIRLNREEEKLFKNYAEYTGKTLSELFKNSLKELIEDRLDYKLAMLALEEYEKDPTTYSIDEVIEAIK